jgi:GT2 family glycosyltransferase
MKIGYVCTNYNNSAYTREAVRSLTKNDGHQFRIVVVDNHSDENNVEALKELAKEFQEVELILNQENAGYFRGLNLGIRRLRESQRDINLMVIGNNDLVFPADFADALLRNLPLFEKYAVVSPDIVTLDGIHQNPQVIRGISKFREFMYDLYHTNYYLAVAIRKIAWVTRRFTDRPDESNYDTAQEIRQGHGACYILGPVFFRHFEELWSPIFLMREEYFLAKQLRERGLSFYYEPSIKVQHCWHAATGKFPARQAWEFERDSHKIRRLHGKMFG